MTIPQMFPKPMPFTVVGCYDDPEEGSYVEHVIAHSPKAAIIGAVLADPERERSRVIAVFLGNLPDLYEPPAGGFCFHCGKDGHDAQEGGICTAPGIVEAKERATELD